MYRTYRTVCRSRQTWTPTQSSWHIYSQIFCVPSTNWTPIYWTNTRDQRNWIYWFLMRLCMYSFHFIPQMPVDLDYPLVCLTVMLAFLHIIATFKAYRGSYCGLSLEICWKKIVNYLSLWWPQMPIKIVDRNCRCFPWISQLCVIKCFNFIFYKSLKYKLLSKLISEWNLRFHLCLCTHCQH